jgi:hypothetical protein
MSEPTERFTAAHTARHRPRAVRQRKWRGGRVGRRVATGSMHEAKTDKERPKTLSVTFLPACDAGAPAVGHDSADAQTGGHAQAPRAPAQARVLPSLS